MIEKTNTPNQNVYAAEYPPAVTLVDRESMSGLSSMRVDGELRNLGIVKNFRDNQEINRYLPENISISWAHLDPHETLETHRHPIASLIIAIQGAGQSKGDTVESFKAGDALLIPAWNEHGFSGAAKDGLWALSIQFNDVAIFENEVDPLTVFDDVSAHLPALSERQIDFIGREVTQQPNSFKSNAQLAKVLPNNIDFAWQKVTLEKELPEPIIGTKRLIIVASGHGKLQLLSSSADQIQPTELKAGDAFWQQQSLSFEADNYSDLWLLFIDVETSLGGVQ